MRRARLFEIGEACLVVPVAGTRQRQPQHLTAAFDEAFEDLPDRALEARGFHAFDQRFFETSGNLALVGDLRNKAHILRTGLAELNLHAISGIFFWSGQRGSRPSCEDGDCD